MIKLPQIPYAMRKNRTQEITIRGLNLSAAVSDGDVSDGENISIKRYPYITQDKKDGNVISNVVSMDQFGGKLAIVDSEAQLNLYDEETNRANIGKLDTEEKGARHMATVNSKLVVFPDKKYYDSSVGEGKEKVKNLGAEACALMLFSKSAVTLIYSPASSTDTKICLSGYGGAVLPRTFTVKQNETYGATWDKGKLFIETTVNSNEKIMGLYTINGGEPYSTVISSAKGNTILILSDQDDLPDSSDQIMYIEVRDGFGLNYRGFFSVISVGAARVGDIFEFTYSLKQMCTGSGDIVLDSLIGKNALIYPLTKTSHALYPGERLCINDSEPFEIMRRETNSDVFYISAPNTCVGDGIYDLDNLQRVGWGNLDLTDYKNYHNVRVWCPQIDMLSNVVEQNSNLTTKSSISIVAEKTFCDYPRYIGTEAKVYLMLGSSSFSEDLTAAALFNPGDTVELSGVMIDGKYVNNVVFNIDRIEGATLYATADIFVEGVANIGDDFTVSPAKIERKIPDLDFICEANNRLYGCSISDNTIYVSALGDPTNMFAYEGVSTDSFAIAVADREKFTGCCRYGSDVLFFKENKIYKLVGSYPAEFALYSYDVEGVEEGSDGSLCVINEVLYYKGIHGIYAYTGGVPTFISQALGEGRYSDACAGTDGVSYLLSMKDERGVYKRFSYNTRLGIWMAEGEGVRRDVVKLGDEVYYIESDVVERGDEVYYNIENSRVMKVGSSSDNGVQWRLQFAPIYETIEGKKTHSRLLIRAEIPRGSYMRIEMRCDGGTWMEVGKIVGRCEGIVPIRIPINRCDKFELKLSGKGPFTILSMQREYYVGSET